LIEDVANKTFSFKFDESTTLLVKKQYGAYVTFFSYRHQTILTAYCGSLFVGHCTDFFEFSEKILDLKLC